MATKEKEEITLNWKKITNVEFYEGSSVTQIPTPKEIFKTLVDAQKEILTKEFEEKVKKIKSNSDKELKELGEHYDKLLEQVEKKLQNITVVLPEFGEPKQKRFSFLPSQEQILAQLYNEGEPIKNIMKKINLPNDKKQSVYQKINQLKKKGKINEEERNNNLLFNIKGVQDKSEGIDTSKTVPIKKR